MTEEELNSRKKKIAKMKRIADGEFYEEARKLLDMVCDRIHPKDTRDRLFELLTSDGFLKSDTRGKLLAEFYELNT